MGIVATSMDGLRYEIQNLRQKQYGTVIDCGYGEGAMIVDFNKMYVPIFPPDFYIAFIQALGEKNGIPRYSYAVMYGKDVILGGDGSLDYYRTYDKYLNGDENDIIYFSGIMIRHDEFKEHEDYVQYEKYVLEDGDKRIIARYNGEDLVIYFIRDKIWYCLNMRGYFDHAEEIPSDEWLLSFDIVKYITD